MYVADLKEGQLYTIPSDVIYRTQSIQVDSGQTIRICNIWKSYATKSPTPPSERSYLVMVYLGTTRTDWKYYGTGKHHWFLIEGERIRVDGHHIKLLEEILVE